MEKINITSDFCNLIERYDYEARIYANIVSFMIANQYSMSDELFKYYQKQHVQSLIQFDTCKHIINEYVRQLGGTEWRINYDSKELTYEKA